MAKRKSEDAPAGSPAWMATFSDLMNLLLCFFVLLFSMSSIDTEKWQQLTAALASTSSAGFIIVMPGIVLIRAISSQH